MVAKKPVAKAAPAPKAVVKPAPKSAAKPVVKVEAPKPEVKKVVSTKPVFVEKKEEEV